MRKIVLEVTGMKCEGCATNVREALRSVDEVHRADVSLEEGRAEVIGEEGVAGDDLVAAVVGRGYGASPVE